MMDFKEKLFYGIIIIGIIYAIYLIPNRRTNSYFVSYYTTTATNGYFGQRVFVAKTLDITTINRMKGLIEEETTNSTAVIISISKLP